MHHITFACKPLARLAAVITLLSALLVMTGSSAGAVGASAQEPPLKSDPTPQGSPTAESVPDQVLIRFRPSVPSGRVDQLLAEHGVSRQRHIKAIDVYTLHLPPGLAVERAVELFGHLPEVEFVEPNYVVHLAQITDPGVANQWAPQKIDAPQAWLVTEGSPAVVIAIVDTGVDYRHSELAPNMWTNTGEIPGNGLDDDGNGFVDDVRGWDFVNNDADPLDDHFHGTHVAGSTAAAATDNPAGVVGVCPRCRIMPVKVMDAKGSGTMDQVATGITYAADNGARVISLSLGASVGSTALQSAVNYAWNKGVVLVAAAGNNGADTRFYPAAYPNVMAVAATNADDFHSCFSNYGDNFIAVSAPGELIYSTTPLDSAGRDTYGTYSGTSMATPHVAGLAGLLFSQDPNRSNLEVRNLIQATAEDLGPAGEDPYFGAGRINANRAVRGDATATTPPQGLFVDDLSASGFPNARKLVRDAGGTLHLTWHSRTGTQYQVLHAESVDGVTWSMPQVVFASEAETYHPTIAADGYRVYIAFPSKDGSSKYRVFFTSRPVSGGSWSPPVALMGGSYNAVRPDLYFDPSNQQLHLVASSYDDAPYVYYTASSNGGLTWDVVRQINVHIDPNSTRDQLTRYAAVYANGPTVYVAGRSVEFGTIFGLQIPYFRLFTISSPDSGLTWSDPTQHAYRSSSEYGAAVAGAGNRLYLAFEDGGSIYFQRFDQGTGWSTAEKLGAGAWPSVTQGDNGQGWVAWESSGSLWLRRYTGSSWDSAETVLAATSLQKGYYPNIELGTNGGRVEWMSTSCSGAPYRLSYDSRALADMPVSPPVQFSAASYEVTEAVVTATVTVTLGSPTTRPVTVTYATSNGTATAGKDYTAANGTLTFAPGETAKTFGVVIKEDTSDEPDETINLTLSNPVNGILGSLSTATLLIKDDDSPPGVAYSSSYYYVQENAGSATVTVRVTPSSGYAVSVDYATADGTAKAGIDYTPVSGTITFAPGETSKTFSVPIIDDVLGEPNKTVMLGLSDPSNAVLGSPATATLTIYANDMLTLSGSNFYVQENAGSAVVTVRLSGPSSVPVTVNYATADGAAKAGSDYTATSGTLTFSPGQTSKTFSVPITDDTLPEPNETITITLSNPTNAVLGSPSTGTVTIYANDAASFSGSNYYVQENAGSASITVRLSGPSSLTTTVDYATANGSALAGSDYLATSGTLTFAPGQTSRTFSVPIIDDSLGEPNETIALALSNPSNVALGSPATATLTIYANDTLSFSSSNFYVQENAGSANVTVKMGGPSSLTVTVNYATSNGTAMAGSDYTATSGTLTFSPGQTSKTISVPIIDDTLKESNETIILTLSNPTDAVLGSPATATLTIWANDAG